MVRLTRRIEVAAKGDLSFDPIKPFMKAEQHAAGHILFCKGDFADTMFVISAGNLLVEEVNITLGEPPRDCRRLFCLSHAATAVSAIMA
jgi:hypothetical protein